MSEYFIDCCMKSGPGPRSASRALSAKGPHQTTHRPAGDQQAPFVMCVPAQYFTGSDVFCRLQLCAQCKGGEREEQQDIRGVGQEGGRGGTRGGPLP